MLAFSVAIRPYEEGRAIASLLCNILSYGLLVGGNSIDDWRIKEGSWWTRGPLTILLGKFELVQMAKYTGHSDLATSPWLAKVEIKAVVLHVNVAGDRMLLQYKQSLVRWGLSGLHLSLDLHPDVEQRFWQLLVSQPRTVSSAPCNSQSGLPVPFRRLVRYPIMYVA